MVFHTFLHRSIDFQLWKCHNIWCVGRGGLLVVTMSMYFSQTSTQVENYGMINIVVQHI